MRHCIAHGTTTVEARIPLDLQDSSHVKTLRMLKGLKEAATICLSVVLSRPEGNSGDDATELPAILDQLLTRVSHKKLADCVSIVCDPNHFPVHQAKAILDRSLTLGLRRKVFASEDWVDGSIAMAAASGADCVEGLNHVTEYDARSLRLGTTIATVFPADAYTQARTPAPARMLADFGVPICLATGVNRDTLGTFSMQAAICEAVRSYRLTAEEAISAATINGAYAVGLGTITGSIEFGKQANLLLLDTSDYRDLTHYYGVNLTGMCIQRGEIVYRRQELSWP